ncbi:hypothetical protein OAF96_02025 [bacterium]|jgi:hypothetical protein|nr:hypothetical protein [bacterium]
MCIFSQPVASVTDTNIFARLESDGWQHLVYQMTFRSKQSNAIILPLPVKLPATDEKSLEFVSLKGYERFFDDLNKGFPLEQVDSKPFSRSGGIGSFAKNSTLKVHEVGDFVASFVPRIPDFNRLDKQFRIPKESWDLLPTYSDYGFAVFQLKNLRGKPHPMAFKFHSRLGSGNDASIFFPTVHIHDGEVHAREDFDHTLFLQTSSYDEACGKYKQRARLVTDSATGYVRSKWAAKEFCKVNKSKGVIDGDSLIHRLKMRGKLRNTDVLAKLDVTGQNKMDSRIGSFGKVSFTAAAGVAGLLGMSWFFNRRNHISGSQSIVKREY